MSAVSLVRLDMWNESSMHTNASTTCLLPGKAVRPDLLGYKQQVIMVARIEEAHRRNRRGTFVNAVFADLLKVGPKEPALYLRIDAEHYHQIEPWRLAR